MKQRRYLVQTIVVAVALLLLGGLGAYWPRWVGAAPPIANFTPSTTIGDGITYQGYLTGADGAPLSGAFTMQFEIYNAEQAGDLLWDSGDRAILVNDGLFAARLEITADIFNGEELWIAQTINGELLTPRQEILPTPLAHTLRPGAIIKGTANAIPNNYLLDVQMNNDEFAFNRGAIFGRSTTGNAIQGLADNGRAIYGQTQDGYAVYGFDGGSEDNRGYAGYFYSTNGIGVYGYSNADRSHPNIYAPAVYGQSNRGVGVYGRGDTSDSYSFYNEGGYFEGGKGLYARGTDAASEQGYGARIYSNNYRGIYVQGRTPHFDAYFGGAAGINTNGIVDRSASSRALVVNLGDTTIEPGDLVAMVGVTTSPESDQPMLGVAQVDASNHGGVIGVAIEAMAAAKFALDDAQERLDFSPTTDPIVPQSYLVIITEGLAPAVNLRTLGRAATWEIGDRVAVSTTGEMERLNREIDGHRIDKDGIAPIAIGKVAGPIDANSGTVPLFINID